MFDKALSKPKSTELNQATKKKEKNIDINKSIIVQFGITTLPGGSASVPRPQ